MGIMSFGCHNQNKCLNYIDDQSGRNEIYFLIHLNFHLSNGSNH